MDERTRQLEVSIAALRADLQGHIVLCDARMRVLWKLAGGLSALVAAIVSVAIAMARP